MIKGRDDMMDFIRLFIECDTEHKWRHLDRRRTRSFNVTDGHRKWWSHRCKKFIGLT